MVVLTSFPHPTEGIRLVQRDTGAQLNNTNLGKGTLYITESGVSWIGSSGDGFSIEYPHISLHAISRDLHVFPEECLFLMLDSTVDDNEEEVDGDDSDSREITEIVFIPEDRGMLDAMFHAMSACQSLHPDPEDSFSEEDFYEDADESVPIDEINSRMANSYIERSRDASAAEGSREVAGRLCSAEAGMAEDSTGEAAADSIQLSHECTGFWSSSNQEVELEDSSIEDDCFDDAEN